MLATCLKRVGFFLKGNVTSRHERVALISWSLPRQRDVTPYRSLGCADVLRGARADVTDFSYMTLMDTSAVKHNMLKNTYTNGPSTFCYNCLPNCRSVFPFYLFFTAIFIKPSYGTFSITRPARDN